MVLPSWLGDVVMATPTLRLLRDALPGSFIAGLARPSVAALLEGTPLLDEIIIERASGVMGPKRVAARVRPLRFDAALLLTNSFSTALTTRIAGIPRRVGYDRDGRGLLLTHRLHAPERSSKGISKRRWAAVPACAYYFAAGRALLGDPPPPFEELHDAMSVLPPHAALELPLSESDRDHAARVLASAGIDARRDAPNAAGPPHFAVLNPGANNPAKRLARRTLRRDRRSPHHPPWPAGAGQLRTRRRRRRPRGSATPAAPPTPSSWPSTARPSPPSRPSSPAPDC
ncbi:MAG: hypothetical protein HND58_18675 [Planctomycetota bacterium]|nr:MAG: hypothetical protein HND58_18675 [Planctomycetota bacterium]